MNVDHPIMNDETYYFLGGLRLSVSEKEIIRLDPEDKDVKTTLINPNSFTLTGGIYTDQKYDI